MLTFYHHPLALFALKVDLLLHEAAIEHRRVEVDFLAGDGAVSARVPEIPTGRLPAISHGGRTVAESNAILRYLAARYRLDAWYPPAPDVRAEVDQWLDFGLVHVAFPISQLFVHRWLARRIPGWPMNLSRCEMMESELRRYVPRLEQRLSSSEHLAGPAPTLADLALTPFLAVASACGFPLLGNAPTFLHPEPDFRHVAGWLSRMVARPAWTKVVPEALDVAAAAPADPPPPGSDARIGFILDFWFGGRSGEDALRSPLAAAWFGAPDPARDRAIGRIFAEDVELAAGGKLGHWEASAAGALALILLLDQMPRHVFRGRPQSHATDPAAQGVCLRALAAGRDRELRGAHRAFLLMPLMHAEALDLQARSVAAFEELRHETLAARGLLREAHRHADVIRRFGRFPGRSRTLRRPLTAEERAYLESEERAP